jgi:hypothetical protein
LDLLLILFLRLDELLALFLHRLTVTTRDGVTVCIVGRNRRRFLERLIAVRVLCRGSAVALLGIRIGAITTSSRSSRRRSVGLLLLVVAAVVGCWVLVEFVGEGVGPTKLVADKSTSGDTTHTSGSEHAVRRTALLLLRLVRRSARLRVIVSLVAVRVSE